ncbi:YqaA family protein [Uliginosibacterium sp. H1]|uniref:YqaA family protein n=1 Tax=Uliginosibacterium sp. H1 TaxID=3114757 RepID=UPI002E1900F1|nr:YqaA family protein [Uliginosibacterium sp. H1]
MNTVNALLTLFLAALIAATLLPTSSEAVLAALLAQGDITPALLIAVAALGNTLGSIINWALGRFLLHYRERRWFPVSAAQLDKATHHYRRWGDWSLLFSWVPVVGDPLTFVAGVLRVPFWRFLLLVATGKTARYLAVWWAVSTATA